MPRTHKLLVQSLFAIFASALALLAVPEFTSYTFRAMALIVSGGFFIASILLVVAATEN